MIIISSLLLLNTSGKKYNHTYYYIYTIYVHTIYNEEKLTIRKELYICAQYELHISI